MNALRPVAGVVPANAQIIRRDFVKPHWDSCDGIKSTYSWDDVTVGVDFNSHGVPDAQIFAHIARALRN